MCVLRKFVYETVAQQNCLIEDTGQLRRGYFDFSLEFLMHGSAS